jgi:hypothetical protein
MEDLLRAGDPEGGSRWSGVTSGVMQAEASGRSGHHRQGGFALLVVLWTVALLALVIGHIAASARSSLGRTAALRAGAEAEAAAAGQVRYRQPFATLAELGLVAGMTPDVLARLTPYVTVHAEEPVNLKVTAPVVVQVLRATASDQGLLVVQPGAPLLARIAVEVTVPGADNAAAECAAADPCGPGGGRVGWQGLADVALVAALSAIAGSRWPVRIFPASLPWCWTHSTWFLRRLTLLVSASSTIAAWVCIMHMR